MKKHVSMTMVAILCVLTVVLAANGIAWSADKKYVIKFASEYFPKHPSVVGAFMPWIEDVKKKSNGRLEIQYFPPGALTPQREHYSAVVSGAVDMAFSPQAFTPGKFPLAEIINLPLVFKSATSGALTTMELYKQFPEWRAEYDDVHFLWTHISALFELHTTKKLVKSLDDLKGMKVIVWLPPARTMAKALGANPVEVSPNDTYLALERGMADGVFCPLAPIRSKKISDAAKYHTIMGLMANPFWAAMNKKKWNSLPPDLQKIMTETTGITMARATGKTLDDGAAADRIAFEKEGHTFYTLPPAEKQKWVDKVEKIHENLMVKLEKKGLKNARKIRATTISLADKLGQ